jgi:hypothetical protein
MIKTRRLPHNEEVRISTALYVALERIKEREEAGEQPRRDGFFDPATDPRGALEGALLSAVRSYDEKKVPYIGAFYASFVFDEAVSISTAHFLLTLLDRLTYHHLCALAYSQTRTTMRSARRSSSTPRREPSEHPRPCFPSFSSWQISDCSGPDRETRKRSVRSARPMRPFGGGVPIVARSASLLALMPLG